MLGLRGADQSPHRGVREIGDILTRPGSDRMAGQQHQPARDEPFLSQPALHQPQHPGGSGVHRSGLGAGGPPAQGTMTRSGTGDPSSSAPPSAAKSA